MSRTVEDLGRPLRSRRPHARSFERRALEYYEPLRRVRDHLEAHIAEPLTGTAAARIAGLSPAYFSSLFHSKVGTRFTDWVRGVRIERAQALLRSKGHSIAEVALRVGFRDLRTFQRAFKRRTSLTPRQYKNRVRPESERSRRSS